jgi:hypothetical protein
MKILVTGGAGPSTRTKFGAGLVPHPGNDFSIDNLNP